VLIFPNRRSAASTDTGLFRRRCLSLVLTVMKICAMSYFAASIHDESMVTRTLLNDVPTESYCAEVARFVHDVVSMNVALTGMKFFSVTRAFILTVGIVSEK
ncbi:unnamed protein product, partial [Timema podura]|nr:unnamed protein product [Timema podura]